MHIVDYPDRPFIDTNRQTGKSDLAKRILEYSRNRMDKYQRELTRKNRYFYAMMNEMKQCGSGRSAIKMKRFRKFRRYLERQMGVKSIMFTRKKPYKHYILDDSISKMYPEKMVVYKNPYHEQQYLQTSMSERIDRQKIETFIDEKMETFNERDDN